MHAKQAVQGIAQGATKSWISGVTAGEARYVVTVATSVATHCDIGRVVRVRTKGAAGLTCDVAVDDTTCDAVGSVRDAR